MSNLSVFQFESNQVRVIEISNEPWFVLADVLTVMGTKSRTNDAKALLLEELGDEVVSVVPILDSLNREQSVLIINEMALTYLISRSRTEMGKNLNKWIHKEVLPTIRKTGAYAQDQQVMEMLKTIMAETSLQKEALANQQKTTEEIKAQNQLLLADKSEAEEIGILIKSEYKGLIELIEVTFGNISDYYADVIAEAFTADPGKHYKLKEVAEIFHDHLSEDKLHDMVCKARCNINGIYHNLTGKYLPTHKMNYVFGKDEILFALWKLAQAAKDLNINLVVQFAVDKNIQELERLFAQ